MIFLFVYYSVIFRYLVKNRDTYAIYSRSFSLLNVSNLLNFLQLICFIILGTMINNSNFIDSQIVFLLFLSATLNHGFFIVNFLKVYRVIILNKLNSANFQMKTSEKLRKRLTWEWNLKVSIIYIIVNLLPKAVLYIYYIDSESHFKDSFYFQLYIQTSIECILLIIFTMYTYKSECDVTLRLEFIIYTIGWTLTIVVAIKNKIEDVCLLIMPIRNLLMSMISTASVYEHIKNYRLPLPDYIDLDFVLHNRFFATQTRSYLKDLNIKYIILFELLLDICIYLEKNVIEYEEKIKHDLQMYNKHSEFSTTIDSNNFIDEIKEIYDRLYCTLDDEFFRDFVESQTFSEIKIDYNSV